MSAANPNLLSYRVKRARRGVLRRRQWVGQVFAQNGRELFRTSETYSNVGDVVAALNLLGAANVSVER